MNAVFTGMLDLPVLRTGCWIFSGKRLNPTRFPSTLPTLKLTRFWLAFNFLYYNLPRRSVWGAGNYYYFLYLVILLLVLPYHVHVY